MALGGLIGGTLTFTWAAFLVFLLVTGSVLLLGHSLGSHRKLIHDSYQCPKWLEYLLVYCGVQVGLAGPLGLLRQHELRDYAQRLPDCHSYLRHGSSFWRDAWWQLHCELHLDNPPQLTIESRIANNKFYQFLEQSWMAQQLPPALLLYAIGGWSFVFWGVCARVTAGILGHWLIGYFAHNRGAMHYRVENAAAQGRNIRFTSLLTMGESWHNNHHAFPGSARLGLFAGEWDPGWWMLMIFRKLGLAWDLKLATALPTRVELQTCDSVAVAMLQRQMRVTSGASANDEVTIDMLRTAQVLRMCWRAKTIRGNQDCQLQGPAATLSESIIRWIVGQHIQFLKNEAADRLILNIEGIRMKGLPALCFLLCTRSPILWAIGIGILPLAIAFETTRQSFDVA